MINGKITPNTNRTWYNIKDPKNDPTFVLRDDVDQQYTLNDIVIKERPWTRSFNKLEK